MACASVCQLVQQGQGLGDTRPPQSPLLWLLNGSEGEQAGSHRLAVISISRGGELEGVWGQQQQEGALAGSGAGMGLVAIQVLLVVSWVLLWWVQGGWRGLVGGRGVMVL